MNSNPILLVSGEPNSIFLELFFKVINQNIVKNPMILISSKKLIVLQMKKLGYENKIRLLSATKLKSYKLDNKTINLIDVEYNPKKAFEKISKKSNTFIKKSFELAFKIIKENNINKFINGPISKKYFLKKEFLGIT